MTCKDFAFAWISFLSENPEAAESFFGETGFSPVQLRDLPINSDFSLGVLDYLLAQEECLLRFCDAHKISPIELITLRTGLCPFDHEVLVG